MSEIYQPPHEKLITNLTTIADIEPFVKKYFSDSIDNGLVAENAQNFLRDKYNASDSFVAPEVPLLLRTWVAAAEYGFPAIFEHRYNHTRYGFEKHFVDPLHLIATLIYLSKRNITMAEKKRAIIDKYKLTDDQIKTVWGMSVQNRLSEAVIPIEYPRALSMTFGNRVTSGVPILVPDINLHEQLAQFSFTAQDAERMTPTDLRREYFPQMRDSFIQICDLEAVI